MSILIFKIVGRGAEDDSIVIRIETDDELALKNNIMTLLKEYDEQVGDGDERGFMNYLNSKGIPLIEGKPIGLKLRTKPKPEPSSDTCVCGCPEKDHQWDNIQKRRTECMHCHKCWFFFKG